MMCCYLGTQCVDDAGIPEDHQRQRHKILNEDHHGCHRLRCSDTAVGSPRYTDLVNNVRRETCVQDRVRWAGNPERAQDRNIRHALFHLLLQKAHIFIKNICINFAVFVLIFTSKLPVPSPLVPFIPYLTTATHCTRIYHGLR